MNLWKKQEWTPMLLSEQKKPFNDSEYIYELKFDGIRAIVFGNKKKVIIKNRHGENITHKFPELQEIRKILDKNTILDGEIVMLENGKPSLSKLQERNHLKDQRKITYQAQANPVLFVCFDLLYYGKNYIAFPLYERKKVLAKLKDNDVFVKITYISTKGIELFQNVQKNQLEGIVAKKKQSPYQISTRSENWVKIKNKNREKFWIYGYEENVKSNVISLMLAEKKAKNFLPVGKVTMAKKNTLYEKLKRQEILENLSDSPEKKKVYVPPIYQCTVEYLEKTKKNHLRHPVLILDDQKKKESKK